MSDAPQYQKRPRFFANYFVRVMTKSCLANTVGPEACWLLSVVAMTEDAKGYREPVTFFNEQLLPLVGMGSVKSLTRAREKAVESGWLIYIPGGKGKAGRYWVNIPPAHRNWDNAPTDESADEFAACAGYPVSISTREPPENRQESDQRTAREPPENRQTSGQHSSLSKDSLSLTDRPPTPEAADESVGRSAAIQFDPLRAEQDARKQFEARWNAAGLRPIKRLTHSLHSRLKALLCDEEWAAEYPAALAKAGKIPFLASGLNRQNGPYDPSEFLRTDDEARKILAGVYDPRVLSPPTPAPVSRADTREARRKWLLGQVKLQNLSRQEAEEQFGGSLDERDDTIPAAA